MSTERVLNDFEGTWRLAKQIDVAGQPPARFEGKAVWSAVEEGLAYRETGKLWIADGAPLEAERGYLWRPGLEVFFDDGRFFHTVPPSGGRAHHHCAPDDYIVDYAFENWPNFTARWTVTGPRKDYVMIARYSR